MYLLPSGMGFLLCGPNLREPALLDYDQGGFETPRQLGCSNASIQRLPTLRQLRVINGCACSKLLGFDDEHFGAARAWSSCAHRSMCCSASSSLDSIEVSMYFCPSSHSAATSLRRTSNSPDVAGGSALPSHSLSLCSNCLRARCSACSRSKRAWSVWRAASQRARRA